MPEVPVVPVVPVVSLVFVVPLPALGILCVMVCNVCCIRTRYNMVGQRLGSRTPCHLCMQFNCCMGPRFII